MPKKLSLARLPTPVEPLPRLSEELGVTLLCKRDDLTGLALSGNKIRKLEFVLAEALAQGADGVITCGGVQSNHCRATAVAARRLGLDTFLLLRTPDGRPVEELDGNLFLDRLVGAAVRFIGPADYERRDEMMAAWATALADQGRRAFVIPEGASDARGALGYVSMVAELAAQIEAGELPGGIDRVDFLVHACGSGGTACGLAVGNRVYGLGARVVSYAVCRDEAYFRARIEGLIRDFAAAFGGIAGPDEAPFAVVDEFKGIGYALSTPEELALIRDVARGDGIFLDPVYTGKAFRGLVTEARQGERYPPGSVVLFVHTGGLFGLFPAWREMALQ